MRGKNVLFKVLKKYFYFLKIIQNTKIKQAKTTLFLYNMYMRVCVCIINIRKHLISILQHRS